MIKKLINSEWQTFSGLKDVKKGDIFKCVEPFGEGPIMQAREDARQTEKNGRVVWSVRAPKVKL